MKIEQQWTYPADIDRVWAMVTDQRFQEERGTAAGALEQEVSVTPQGAGAAVSARRRMPTSGIPAQFQRFVADGVTLVETQTWQGPAADGSRTADVDVQVQGVPVTMRGTMRMAPAGESTTMTFDGELKAAIPLLGKQIEKAAEPGVAATVQAERAVGERYLAG